MAPGSSSKSRALGQGYARDNDGKNGSCLQCSEHFRNKHSIPNNGKHVGTTKRRRLEKAARSGKNQNESQNFKARKEWIWTHCLNSDGSWVGHKTCISKISGASIRTLTNIQSQMKKTYQKPDGWDDSDLKTKRKYLLKLIRDTGSQAPVKLPADGSRPPLHGNCFKESRQKSLELEKFKEFIVLHSTPTGRTKSGRTHYLLPTIQHYRAPKKPKQDNPATRFRSESMLSASLVFQFNESLKSVEGATKVGHSTLEKWMATYFPTYGKSPPKSDYCDTCAEYDQEIKSARRTLGHYVNSGNGDQIKIQDAKNRIASYQALLSKHHDLAVEEQKEYKKAKQSCREKYKSMGENCSEAVLDCDFQMVKLLPHWGKSPQPSKTYYYQKLQHHIFGIVDHRTQKNFVYVTENSIGGAKDSNHVLSHLDHYVKNYLSPKVRHLRLNLDSAAYFKTKYIVWWAAAMKETGRFEDVKISFMVPGHTKFTPDWLFSQIANRFNISDIFNIQDLLTIISACEDTTAIETLPKDYRDWKKILSGKYRSISNIQVYNFMSVEKANDTSIVLRAKTSSTKNNYETISNGSTRLVLCTEAGIRNVVVRPSVNDSALHIKSLRCPMENSKLRNVCAMYKSYVLKESWPDVVKKTNKKSSRTSSGSDKTSSSEESISLRTGKISNSLGTVTGIAQASEFLKSLQNPKSTTNEEASAIVKSKPDLGVRTTPRKQSSSKKKKSANLK